MISPTFFCDELWRRGFILATGVPCSHFGGPIEVLSREPGRYIPAANEGNALAIAAGATLAGTPTYVMLQNSGLGNLINPLTSLLMTFDIPVLTFVSLRGWPDPNSDEPQHYVMGPATGPLLETLELSALVLRAEDDEGRFHEVLDKAQAVLDRGEPAFVLVEMGAVSKATPAGPLPQPHANGLATGEVIETIAAAEDCVLIATTGYTGRELYALADHPTNFYMQGSMGHASSIALGVATAQPERTVVVLDGDGAALMYLGAMSVIGHEAPTNLIHVILDNGAHESTGGQHTTSSSTDFAAVASACGYRTATECRTLDELEHAMRAARAGAGPHAVIVPTRLREGALPPRATNSVSPKQLRNRFAEALATKP